MHTWALTGLQPQVRASLANPAWLVGWRLLLLWLGSLLVLLIGLGQEPLSRSQEARVLETAREINQGSSWLVPHVNGHVRLKKPPLAYWLSAISFKIFGVGEASGRLPMAVCGWLTIGITFLVARWLFCQPAAFFASASLLGTTLFFRHSRLAETDVLVMLTVTGAIYAIWRGYEALASPQNARPRSVVWWFHLSAVGIALAVLSKGPPAMYPLIFLAALSACDRRWDIPWRWIRSGAPITLVLLAAPWFIYILCVSNWQELVYDLRQSASVSGHSEWFIQYVPELVAATVPWTGFVVVALAAGTAHARHDRRVRGLFLWMMAILVPLCVWGSKQPHYLMPLLPPMMILVGWLVDSALRQAGPRKLLRALGAVLIVTTGGMLLSIPAFLAIAHVERGWLGKTDAVVASTMLALVGVIVVIHLRAGTQRAVYLFGLAAIAAVAVVEAWVPSLEPVNMRSVAGRISAEFGRGPYAFWHGGENLPLCFHMRSVIPMIETDMELRQMLEQDPNLVLIDAVSKYANVSPTSVPLHTLSAFQINRRRLVLYRAELTAAQLARHPPGPMRDTPSVEAVKSPD